tara:strand:+ start:1236 stop:2255 length:1020 start_codon:yes stop_codon:yes gene_type:complete
MRDTLIIAEAGVNHNGDISLAKKLIDIAVDAGANVVKFQSFKANRLVSKKARKADYQIKNIGGDETQYKMLNDLELSIDQAKLLNTYCKSKNILFCSTPFDIESLNELGELNMPFIKIPSGEITNYPFLEKISKIRKQIILSSGMSSLNEINNAIKILTRYNLQKEDITVLHCNTEYPTPMNDVNMNAMSTISSELGVKVGYSDHTLGIEIPIAAVALGASVIEKHFTINRTFKGPDHKASLEPNELKKMIKSIRNIEKAMGSSVKKPSNSELKNIEIVRKSIHLLFDVKKGKIIKNSDLIMLRPGDGISPMLFKEIIGKKTNKDLTAGHKLNLKDFEK